MLTYWDMIQDERCSKLKIYPILQKVLSLFLSLSACTNSIQLFLMLILFWRVFGHMILKSLYGIYQVYLERILRKPEIDAFAEELKPHQVINICCCFQMSNLWLVLFLFYISCRGSPFIYSFRKHFCQIILLCWIVPWLSIIFWVPASFTPT